mmetsp:Transcript_38546/g.81792  ORF Transcript_38546/g.81792 Transcript_38546/m.81792 type:complete len:418 (-) Transcript_38546:69-1322(-)
MSSTTSPRENPQEGSPGSTQNNNSSNFEGSPARVLKGTSALLDGKDSSNNNNNISNIATNNTNHIYRASNDVYSNDSDKRAAASPTTAATETTTNSSIDANNNNATNSSNNYSNNNNYSQSSGGIIAPLPNVHASQKQWQKRALRRALARGISARNQYFDSFHMPSTPSSPTKGGRLRGSGQAFLHIYDLKGVAGLNDTTISMGLGVFHVGIEVYGVEWSYGYFDSPNLVSGVYPFHPKKCPIGTYRESQSLGPIRAHSAADVWRLLEALATEWLGHEYHPLKYNCLDFCRELSRLLHLQEMPTWVGRLATVADALLTPLLDSFQVRLVPHVETEEAERPEHQSCSESTDTSQDEPEGSVNNDSVASSLPPSKVDPAMLAARLSAETTVALDFECRYNWAWKKMQNEEGKLHRSIPE